MSALPVQGIILSVTWKSWEKSYEVHAVCTGNWIETDSFRMYRFFRKDVITFKNVYFGKVIMKYSNVYFVW